MSLHQRGQLLHRFRLDQILEFGCSAYQSDKICSSIYRGLFIQWINMMILTYLFLNNVEGFEKDDVGRRTQRRARKNQMYPQSKISRSVSLL